MSIVPETHRFINNDCHHSWQHRGAKALLIPGVGGSQQEDDKKSHSGNTLVMLPAQDTVGINVMV